MKQKKIKKYNENKNLKYIHRNYQWLLLIRLLKESHDVNTFKQLITISTNCNINSIIDLANLIKKYKNYFGNIDNGYDNMFRKIPIWVVGNYNIRFINVMNWKIYNNIRLSNKLNEVTYKKQNTFWEKCKSLLKNNNETKEN